MLFSFDRFPYYSNLLTSGWSSPETSFVWSNAERSSVHLPLLSPKGLALVIRFHAYLGGGRQCSFHLVVNGHYCGNFATREFDNVIEVRQIENRLSPEFGLYIDFYHMNPTSPLLCREGEDSRKLNLALYSIEVVAAEEVVPLQSTESFSLNSHSHRHVASMNQQLWQTLQTRDAILQDNSADALRKTIDSYVRGVGGNADDRRLMRDRIITLLRGLGDDQDPFRSGRLRKELIAKYCPELENYVLTDKSSFDETVVTILQKTKNVYYDPDFAAPWQKYLPSQFAKTDVPEEAIFSSSAADIVVDNRRYMVISSDKQFSFAGCNHADLSALSIPDVVSSWNGPIVLLQDQFDCGNVAHFLFDSMVRLLHWCAHFPEEKARAAFVFGGAPREFHRLILAAAAKRLGVEESRFWFPSTIARLRPTEKLFWFASQLTPQRPSNLMRAESVSLLKAFATDVLASVAPPAQISKRIYISRIDAGGRKPQNERQIIELLEPLGFRTLIMSEYSWQEQIGVVANAEYIVAPHGMGLTHLTFNTKRPRVIELFNPFLFSDEYALLARAYGDDYVRIIGEQVDPKTRNFHIDIELLRSLI